MKYEFKELSLDNYELHYIDTTGKEKILPFKRTVELAEKLQSADADARFKMLDYLQKRGKSKNDLIIERHENGKTIIDETNYREFEASFMEKEATYLLIDVYKLLFNKTPDEVLFDMGADKDPEKAQDFTLELREILINGKLKTPSTQKGNK